MEKKLDLRVQKTRSALTSALYDLMSKKSLDEITVTELCQQAMVRKATFYKHFGDKTELLEYMIQELQRISTEENTIGYDPKVPYSYYSGVFEYLLDFIESNDRFVLNVLKSNSSSFVRNILEEQIRREIDCHLKTEDNEDIQTSHAMLSSLYAGAIVSCCIWWGMQKNRPAKEEMTGQFIKFISKI